MDEERRVEVAAEGIKRLEIQHSKFLDHLNENSSDLGEINTDGELSAKCLGILLDIHHTVVVVNRLPRLMEYSFRVQHGDTEVEIFTMYLDPNGGLHYDSQKKNRICDFDNPYNVEKLLKILGERLLDSAIFSPRDNG